MSPTESLFSELSKSNVVISKKEMEEDLFRKEVWVVGGLNLPTTMYGVLGDSLYLCES